MSTPMILLTDTTGHSFYLLETYGGNRTSEHSNFDVTTSEISKKKGNKVTNPDLNAMKEDTD